MAFLFGLIMLLALIMVILIGLQIKYHFELKSVSLIKQLGVDLIEQSGKLTGLNNQITVQIIGEVIRDTASVEDVSDRLTRAV